MKQNYIYIVDGDIPTHSELDQLERMFKIKPPEVVVDYKLKGFILETWREPNEHDLLIMQLAFPHWRVDLFRLVTSHSHERIHHHRCNSKQ